MVTAGLWAGLGICALTGFGTTMALATEEQPVSMQVFDFVFSVSAILAIHAIWKMLP